MGYIYMITNLVTQQKYIGQTTQELEERWRNHCKKSSKCTYLKRAINKHGQENFAITLICICFDDELEIYEKDYIIKHNTLTPNGYNLKIGGNLNSSHHLETKLKISNSLKEYYKTHEPRKPQLGIPHKAETKEKISKSLTGRKFSEEHLQKMQLNAVQKRKSVVQLDSTGKVINTFVSITDAAKCLNIPKSCVSRICHSGKSSKYVFKFENEYKKEQE